MICCPFEDLKLCSWLKGGLLEAPALSALVKRGLMKSDTPQGRVRFALRLHALRFYFPALWPEAEADAAAEGG